MANDDLGDLIGKFLAGLGQQQPPPIQQPPQQQRPQRPRPNRGERPAARNKGQAGRGGANAEGRPGPTPQNSMPRSSDDVVSADIVEVEPVSGDDVAEHVERHLSTADFSQRAARLGDEVVHAPDDIQQHLADVFGHGPKGRLTGDHPTVASPSASGAPTTGAFAAGDLAKLLRSPKDLRMAFIMSEVLRRPEW